MDSLAFKIYHFQNENFKNTDAPMHSFVKELLIEEVENPSMGYMTTERTKIYLPIVKKIIEASHGSVVTIYGSRGSGRHSFVTKEILETKKKSYIVDVEEIKDNGKLCDQKLHKVIRSVTTVEMKENMKVVEGEVISISNDKIQLKTRDMESVFDIGTRIRNELERERVCIGDIIKIYKENCFVTKQGRSDDRNASSRSDILPKLALPEGECIRNELVRTTLNLNELDVLNSQENGEECLYKNVYVGEYIRDEVDKKVIKLLKEGKAELDRGVLVVDGCETLADSEIRNIISLCNGLLHPTIFLIFDQNISNVFAGEISLKFFKYNNIEISAIIKGYCDCNCILIEMDAVELLSEVAISKGLHTAIRVLKASVISQNILINTIRKILEIFEE